MTALPITESDLHAYLDGRLPEARRGEIEDYLGTHPEEAARVASYRAHNEQLRAVFDPVFDEPVPQRLVRRPALLDRYAAVVAWMAFGMVIGWGLHGLTGGAPHSAVPRWAQRAVIAHIVYTPEVRHPVEVAADQETHLVNWLSKRLGTRLKVPRLSALGYKLMGGRLLPGEKGPVAQFMYQNAAGGRLTLYVRTNAQDNRETAFRFAQEDHVDVFYWIDGKLGYALSGQVGRQELLRVATAVYRQLNP